MTRDLECLVCPRTLRPTRMLLPGVPPPIREPSLSLVTTSSVDLPRVRVQDECQPQISPRRLAPMRNRLPSTPASRNADRKSVLLT